MAFEHYIPSGNKKLRCGYTTGTCAALAAMASTQKLLLDVWQNEVSILTPKGLRVTAQITEMESGENMACCGIRKDAGDDIDCTAGILIKARAELRKEPGIFIDGGIGVGRVTKPGLDQAVGMAAINSTPREMIRKSVQSICDLAEYHGGIHILIEVPEGEQIAQKTFNPHLGIEGGISILGTSGIVEPMSQQALIDTIHIEIRQHACEGEKALILTPGNYGVDFLRKAELDSVGKSIVKCSNFIGEALDSAGVNHFEQVLLVGHIGKLVKLAGGIMNTHSRIADCRTEIFCAHAAIQGAGQDLCRKLMDCATADACIALLKECKLDEKVLQSILQKAEEHVLARTQGSYEIGLLIFSNEYGELVRTKKAEEILERWKH